MQEGEDAYPEEVFFSLGEEDDVKGLDLGAPTQSDQTTCFLTPCVSETPRASNGELPSRSTPVRECTGMTMGHTASERIYSRVKGLSEKNVSNRSELDLSARAEFLVHTISATAKRKRLDIRSLHRPTVTEKSLHKVLRAFRLCSARVVENVFFEWVVGMLIFLHMVFLTVRAQLPLVFWNHLSAPVVAAQMAFCTLYCFEISLRFIAAGAHFFRGGMWMWNVFDACLTSVVLLVQVAVASPSGVCSSISCLIILRFGRFVEPPPITRHLRLFTPFKLVVRLISYSMRYVLPCTLLVCVVPYVSALFIAYEVRAKLSVGGVTDPTIRASLEEKWLLVGNAMRSLYIAVMGGADWEVMSTGLWDASWVAYAVFLFHHGFTRLFVLNIVASLFFQCTLEAMNLDSRQRLRMLLEDADRFVEMFTEIFGTNVLDFQSFSSFVEKDAFLNVLEKLELSPGDAENLFWELSAADTKNVELTTFVRGSIMLKETATKLDILPVANLDVARAHVLRAELKLQRNFANLRSIDSIANKTALKIMSLGGMEELVKRVTQFCNEVPMEDEEERSRFLETTLTVARLIIQLEGGCGFLIAPISAFMSVKSRNIDFQVTDRNENFPEGYMTEQLKDVHVGSSAFAAKLQEFAKHTDDDRWPPGHAAAGLPKDGFVLLSSQGFRLKCAARLTGLPTPPFRWDNVGSRHLSALAACWAFRLQPSIVIVRSETGKIHVLHVTFENSRSVLALAFKPRRRPDVKIDFDAASI